MTTRPRGDISHALVLGIYHCYARCVRQAHLFGKNSEAKKDYEYRRNWVEERIAKLAKFFAIDVIHMAVMSNHFHLVLRNLPQLVKKWSDREVIKRVIQIFPSKFERLGVKDGKPTRTQLRNFVQNRKLVRDMRLRLSDISWFMRQLNQYIARRANAEDEKTGHFFESRFKSKLIVDEMGVLICGVYIDLNQLRALEAYTPETSTRTSVFRRIKALKARRKNSPEAADWDGFLCPINTRGDGPPLGYIKAGTFGSRRASDQGVLEMTVEQYIEIVDWVGRQLRPGKPGKIDSKLPPILERLGLSGTSFVKFVEDYDTLFRVGVGGSKSLTKLAKKLHRKWLHRQKEIAALEAQE